MAMSASTLATSRLSGATTVAASEKEIMNTSTDVGSIRENGTELDGANFALGAQVAVNNNFRGREGVGSQPFIDIKAGRAVITGSIETYLDDESIINRLQNDTASSFDTRLVSPALTEAYVIDMPKMKFSSGGEEVEGIDSDITPDLEFQALRDETYEFTVQFQRFRYFV